MYPVTGNPGSEQPGQANAGVLHNWWELPHLHLYLPILAFRASRQALRLRMR